MYKKKLVNDEQIEYLRKITKGRTVAQTTIIFNQRYIMNLTQKQIINLKKRYKITSGVDTKFKSKKM